MAPRFIKFHGFGNDYIVIESRELALTGITATTQLGNFANASAIATMARVQTASRL